ncbi:MAG: pyridoxal phosphate-dependent aminotransferase [Fibrobacteraceae bacterium]|nr:pyridoxal phosphate-dependent aminotransferase [Fibrobacteraceae bacterium]
MLSSRLPKDLSPSPFFCQLEKSKKEVFSLGAAPGLIDLTVSSPIKVGLPAKLNLAVEKCCSEFGSWVADASGQLETRRAVVNYYKRRGGLFTTDQILLTASTSEAYSILFKVFCNPGDAILTPLPGYPLLDTLAALEHLECYPYFLQIHREPSLKKMGAEKNRFRFVLDTDSLLSAPENAKILLLVSPHNPTGHCISRQEWNQVVAFCEERNLVLVVDEVFGDYPLGDGVKRSYEYLEGTSPSCPIFWLNGLSKTVGSPQLKLGWMAMYIPEDDFEKIHEALEFVTDAYLSVSSTAQALAKPLLEDSWVYEQAVLQRTSENYQYLRSKFSTKVCPEVLGGWYAALRLANDDEQMTLDLLQKHHVLVQPGFFFDFEEDGWIVISLLQEPETFRLGVNRIFDAVQSVF